MESSGLLISYTFMKLFLFTFLLISHQGEALIECPFTFSFLAVYQTLNLTIYTSLLIFRFSLSEILPEKFKSA